MVVIQLLQDGALFRTKVSGFEEQEVQNAIFLLGDKFSFVEMRNPFKNEDGAWRSEGVCGDD